MHKNNYLLNIVSMSFISGHDACWDIDPVSGSANEDAGEPHMETRADTDCTVKKKRSNEQINKCTQTGTDTHPFWNTQR